ncbi:MAG: NosD domain-containing protein, partial [Planctomycetota bacterium]
VAPPIMTTTRLNMRHVFPFSDASRLYRSLGLGCLVSVTLALIPGISLRTKAEPLPAIHGPTVRVTSVEELEQAVQRLTSGVTILIAPGKYPLRRSLVLMNHLTDIGIRGESGKVEDVEIIGRGMRNKDFGNVPHGIMIGGAENVLLAHFTLKDFWFHPISLHGERGCKKVRMHGLRLVDAGEQFLKGNVGKDGHGVDNGIVEHCIFEFTDTSRGEYTNGLSILGGSNWIIRDNLFRNLRAPNGELAGPAVLMWRGCKNTRCERNTFVNCQRGIAFGLVDGPPFDHVGGVIQDNTFYRNAEQPGDAGIMVNNSPGTKVIGNTVILSGTYAASIEYRFRGTTNCVIENNVCDMRILRRDGAIAELQGNRVPTAAERDTLRKKFEGM